MRKRLLLILLLCGSAFGALATPVSITSVTGGPSVWTVTTASAHSLAANNPGFCIVSSAQSADNVCSTAGSVTDATHYTVTNSSMVACASSCGTSQPAPLFVLRSSLPNFGIVTVSGCMWTFVANGAPIPNAVSSCSSSLPSSIQSAANGAIASGNWIERPIARDFPASYPVTTIQNQILDLQLALQNAQGAASSPGGSAGKSCDVTGCN